MAKGFGMKLTAAGTVLDLHEIPFFVPTEVGNQNRGEGKIFLEECLNGEGND